ncbi:MULTISPECIES: Mov34/MPN/PAD-1 family protein [unclassified Rhizobium]|uniref:Mov34/MPN/PAD-1 family protein n=1 Tax=unclassified Rhizobium TaxID=2613769 RepID=UPI0028895863|nr:MULTISPECIES: Mov34/MPN/PAD-1 family protein [unclassified Rhizobium]
MSAGKLELVQHAEHLLRVVRLHPQVRGAELAVSEADECRVAVVFEVEMPFDVKARGLSATGVCAFEAVEIVIRAGYPWRSPTIYLRQDFPRDLPHLQPSSADTLPRPCLVDGSQDEFFSHFALIESGIIGLLEQLASWLANAAVDSLINPAQGWEPALRGGLSDTLIVDSEFLEENTSADGAWTSYRTYFLRSFGSKKGPGVSTFLEAGTELASLSSKTDKTLFQGRRLQEINGISGTSVMAFITPDPNDDGTARINNRYLPETVTNLTQLHARAKALGCGRHFREFMETLVKNWTNYRYETSVPIMVIFAARRPFHLIGSVSNFEHLPYLFEIYPRPGRKTLWDEPGDDIVKPTRLLSKATPKLLSKLSPITSPAPTALIGAGSVGSKVALHLARAGVSVTAITDTLVLMPHNMARHALVRPALTSGKAEELATELKGLGQTPAVCFEDAVEQLRTPDGRLALAPENTERVLNSTASLLVREALSIVPKDAFPPRISEIALFGRGRGAFLLQEGAARNPTLADLLTEMSAHATPAERNLLFNPEHGLTEVQIGQGCGSLTMIMTDARLSTMTAAATEILLDQKPGQSSGTYAIGHRLADDPSTHWRTVEVEPFVEVAVEGSDGWQVRISPSVDRRIREEVATYPHVETGGLLIGTTSARCQTITVVDILPAPEDSRRKVGLFELGTKGLKTAIRSRHRASGGSLFDVGTWHSHLADMGPSSLDRKTAAQLAAERPPPSVLLIITPNRYHALVNPNV